MTPFISIIIPFYGTADPVLLQRCITSIREQGMEEGSYEIIVADDNGKGLGGARNRGIGRATGIYLMFVDADDYLFPNILLIFVRSGCVRLRRKIYSLIPLLGIGKFMLPGLNI